jgi:hypothetical protein
MIPEKNCYEIQYRTNDREVEEKDMLAKQMGYFFNVDEFVDEILINVELGVEEG